MSCLSGCSADHCTNWWLPVRPCFPPQDDFDVTPTAILSYVERKFIKLVVAAVKKEIKLIKDRRYFPSEGEILTRALYRTHFVCCMTLPCSIA